MTQKFTAEEVRKEAGMKDKLRELAERWNDEGNTVNASNLFACGKVSAKRDCATELLAILDADGVVIDEWVGEIECCDAKGFWLILADDCPFVPGQKVTITATKGERHER